jgi:alkaline phosphatase D
VFDERERAANPTMLGEEQRGWLTETLRASSATWKIWASGTVVAPMVLDLRAYEAVPQAIRNIVYFKLDQWDGYRSERARILGDLDGVRNLVVLSGDIHAFYASHLHVDFDAPGATPVGVELTAAGISSASVEEQTRTLVESSPLLNALGLGRLVDEFDPNMQTASPHLVYANSATQGIMIVEIDGDRELRAMTVEFDDVRTLAYPKESRIERFAVTSGTSTLRRVTG